MKTLADLTAPAKQPSKRMLEADLQEQCVEWARRRGYWARKFSSISQRSVPDFLFSRAKVLVIDGEVDDCWAGMEPGTNKIKFACEFKRPGCPIDKESGVMSTQAQVDEQNAMRAAGWFVFECDGFEFFKTTVLEFESACKV